MTFPWAIAFGWSLLGCFVAGTLIVEVREFRAERRRINAEYQRGRTALAANRSIMRLRHFTERMQLASEVKR